MAFGPHRQRRSPARLTEDDVVSYVLERFEEVRREGTVRALTAFQAKNKYLVMAHDQEGLKKLGNIAANRDGSPAGDMLARYRAQLVLSLERQPTDRTNLNVMMHVMGHVGGRLGSPERRRCMSLIRGFRDGRITLGDALAGMESVICRLDSMYLGNQTYYLLYADAGPEAPSFPPGIP